MYVTFLSFIAKVDFKQMRAEEKTKMYIAASIFSVIRMNYTTSSTASLVSTANDSVVSFYFFIFVKKFLLSFDVRGQSDLLEAYADIILPIKLFIQSFNEVLAAIPLRIAEATSKESSDDVIYQHEETEIARRTRIL